MALPAAAAPGAPAAPGAAAAGSAMVHETVEERRVTRKVRDRTKVSGARGCLTLIECVPCEGYGSLARRAPTPFFCARTHRDTHTQKIPNAPRGAHKACADQTRRS